MVIPERPPIDDSYVQWLMDNRDVAYTILMTDDYEYFRVCHWIMFHRQFTFLDFHKRIADKFNEYVAGIAPKRNCYIGMPPRHGKSQVCVYLLGKTYAYNRNSNNIYTSYSADLAIKHSIQVRTLVDSELFHKVFDISVGFDGSSAQDKWKVARGGEFRAVSFGGQITGFGAGTADPGFGGMIVVDDYMKPAAAYSQSAKFAVYSYLDETLCSRKNKEQTPIFCIAQRICWDDLVGYILGKVDPNVDLSDDWEILTEKALRDDGTALWPLIISAESLQEMKRKRPYVFAAQYQQEPIKRIDGALFENPSMTGKLADLNGGQAHIDAGYGGPDTTGLTLFKKQPNGRITMLCKIYKTSVVNHIKTIKALCDSHNIRLIWCETNADKGFLGKEFQREGLAARTYSESQNKFYKISTFLKKYWEDIDFCPESDQDAINQILEFTETCDHDDCADSAATACRIIEKYSVVRADII